jgi:hypothetical protein
VREGVKYAKLPASVISAGHKADKSTSSGSLEPVGSEQDGFGKAPSQFTTTKRRIDTFACMAITMKSIHGHPTYV